MAVYRVYWSTVNPDSEECDCPECSAMHTHAKDFCKDEMSEALNFCAELRADKDNSFITMVAEDPNCTSLSGVSAPSSDYNWTKRRGGRK